MGVFETIPLTFEWQIQNISYNGLNYRESIESVPFTVYITESIHSRWSLALYPKGIVDTKHAGVFMRREIGGEGPKIIVASFEFAFLDKNGSVVDSKTGSNRGFAIGSVSGIGQLIKQNKIFGKEKKKFFPGDIVIIRCTMWIKDEQSLKMERIGMAAMTVFEIRCRSFLWKIENFSILRPEQSNRFVIKNEGKTILMTFDIVSDFEGEIKLEINFWHESLKYFSFKSFVIDSDEKRVSFGNPIIFTFYNQKDCTLLLSPKQLMQNKSRYLPNDVLTLACEYAFSTGAISHTYENVEFGLITSYLSKEVSENVEVFFVNKKEPDQAKDLANDLESMYIDAVLCDIELRTSTQSFPAHKNILSARSSVFRSMFNSDMREKNSGHVDITDLEEDTVRRMLLYIYTDALGDLQFESASKLYSTADKYAIFSLKNKCSCFLKHNITPSTACDLLTLADTHQDDDFKCAVQNYILDHDKEVFGSLEWKDLMETHLQLAADIMYRKVYPTNS